MRVTCATAASISISAPPIDGAAFADLRRRHDAIFVGTGVYRARDITVPGSGLAGIVPALDYLTASNRKGLGDAVAGVRGRHA